MNAGAFYFHKLILRPLVRILFDPQPYGDCTVAHFRQFLLVANHNSHVDTLVLFSLLSDTQLRSVRIAAAADHFRTNKFVELIVGWLFTPVWIDRLSPEAKGYDDLAAVISAGDSLIVFPEGSRGEPDHLSRFHSGVARLAQRYPELPVIPLYMSGPAKALPRGAAIPLPQSVRYAQAPAQYFAGTVAGFTELVEQLFRELDRQYNARGKAVSVAKKAVKIAVMGIDGSGKSTLSRALARSLSDSCRSALISDSLECYEKSTTLAVQPLLLEVARKKMSSVAKGAASLKSYKIPKLIEMLLRDQVVTDAQNWYHAEVVVQDGSPLLNLIGWSLLYQSKGVNDEMFEAAISLLSGRQTLPSEHRLFELFPELKLLSSLLPTSMNLPDQLIFLDVAPELSCQRIASRGERVQAHENLEKLTQMREGYLRVCNVVERSMGVDVIRLDAALGQKQIERQAIDFVRNHGEMR